MTGRDSSKPLASASTRVGGDGGELPRIQQIAAAVKRRWEGGETPNLADVLTGHPELKGHRTVVLNLAYEEYRLRLQAGETLDAEAFARRYPSLQRSLHLLIAVHSLLAGDSDLLALQRTIQWPGPGTCFLGFDLLAEIGRGAFGRVFLASELALGQRQVVLKVALQGGQEAEILGRLRHPHIVPIYSVQEDETTGLTAFCMPYLGRATLAHVLDEIYTGRDRLGEPGRSWMQSRPPTRGSSRPNRQSRTACSARVRTSKA